MRYLLAGALGRVRSLLRAPSPRVSLALAFGVGFVVGLLL